MHDTIKATQNTTQLFKNNMGVETARYTVQIRRITANERRQPLKPNPEMPRKEEKLHHSNCNEQF